MLGAATMQTIVMATTGVARHQTNRTQIQCESGSEQTQSAAGSHAAGCSSTSHVGMMVLVQRGCL